MEKTPQLPPQDVLAVYPKEKYPGRHDKKMLPGDCVRRFVSLNTDGSIDVVYRRTPKTNDGGKKETPTVAVKQRSK